MCQWKCGNACDHAAPNTSGNETFAQVVDRVLARRTVLAGALAAARLVSKLLFGVGPTDAPTLAGAALLLLGVAALASALPAGRALRVQPSVTLREP